MVQWTKKFWGTVDKDTKLTVAGLLLMFVTWVIDFVRNPAITNQLFFPLLLLFVIAFYLLIVSEGLRQEEKIEKLMEDKLSFLRDTFPDLMLRKIQIRENLDSMGIMSVMKGRDDKLFLDKLSSCKQEICLMAISLYNYVALLRTIFPQILADKQLTVRILIAKPGTVFLEEKEREEKLPGRINAEISGVEGMLQGILKDAIFKGYKGTFEVREYEGMTYCTMYIFDNERIWYNPYLRRIPGKDVPVYEIDRKGKEIFEFYLSHFDAVWKDERTKLILSSEDHLKAS